VLSIFFCFATAALGDGPSRAALFMALWTLKESVVKAKGSGVSAPPGLKGFSIRE
jgi:phosphopantetheinyl transferase